MCTKCQHVFSFNAIEKFFAKSHRPGDFVRAQDLFLNSKPKKTILTIEAISKDAIRISEMADTDLQQTIDNLGLKKIATIALQGVHAFCDAKRKSLYFPMLDIESNIVGYKALSMNDAMKMTETTFPEQNSFGAVIFPPMTKRGYREHKTAIIVLNLADALALRMEKTNG